MTCGCTDGLPPDLMPISRSRRLFGRLFIFLVLLCTPLFVLPTYAQSSVVIGEVQWAGSENSSADEWIELWNLGSAPFSLKNFHLRGAGSGTDLVFGPQDQIAPQSAFLIANYHALDQKSTLSVEAQTVSTTLSLTNEQTDIALLNTNGEVLDEVHWEKIAPGGSNVSPRSSMIRLLNGTSSSLLWTSATTSKNLITTAHQFGGPGICEGCSTIPIQSSPDIATAAAPQTQSKSTPEPTPLPTEPLEPPPEDASIIAALPPGTSSTEDLAQSLLDAGIDPSSLETELAKEQGTTTTPLDTPISVLPAPALDETLSNEETASTTAPSNLITASTDRSPEAADTKLDVPLATSSSASLEGLLPPLDHFQEVPLPTTTTATTSQVIRSESANPLPTNATSTIIEEAIQTPSPSPEIPIPTPILLPPVGTRIHFSEIYPSPATGAEWIELKLDQGLLPSDLSGWSIHDKNKTLLMIRPTTIFTWNLEKRLLVFSFENGKLPNKGTLLSLVDINGHTEDSVLIPTIGKNQSFVHTEDNTWKQTSTPTPGTENRVTAIISLAKSITLKKTPAQLKTPVIKSISTTTPKIKKSPSVRMIDSPSIQRKEKDSVAILMAATTSTNATLLKIKSGGKKQGSASLAKITTSKATKAVKKQAIPKKKSLQKKASTEPQTIDLKNIGPMYASTRVRITGTVATLPRLLGNNAFVIQTDDGRGLYISGNSKQSSPPFRAHIALTGTLSVNDDGLILHMYATDRWKLLELERAVQPRVPDLDQPSLEDAWSYIQLKGIVSSVSPTRVTMLHNGTEIAISIRPVVHYRVERLKKGDEIEVNGILDTRKDSLTLLPRLADEIRVLKNAPLTTSEAVPGTHTPLPWMPVGAAGMSIAVTQGARRYWKYRLEQKIRFSEPN